MANLRSSIIGASAVSPNSSVIVWIFTDTIFMQVTTASSLPVA